MHATRKLLTANAEPWPRCRMLFDYQENLLEKVLEGYQQGLYEVGEALLLVVRDDEVIQEIKAQNSSLLTFLAANVLGLVELVRLDGPEAGMATEILCSELEELGGEIVRGDGLETIFLDGLLGSNSTEAALSRWERIASSVVHRHGASFHRFSERAGLFEKMVACIERGQVARMLARTYKKVQVDATPLVARLPISANAAMALLEIGGVEFDQRLIDKTLNATPRDELDEARVAACITVLRRAAKCAEPETLALAIPKIEALLDAGDASRLGPHRLEAVRLIADVAPKSSAYARLASRCVSFFFAFKNHTLLHRAVTGCVVALIESDESSIDLIDTIVLDCDLLRRIAEAASAQLPSSLRAHALLICEALANKLYQDLPLAASQGGRPALLVSTLLRRRPQDLEFFLTALALRLSRLTLHKQGLATYCTA